MNSKKPNFIIISKTYLNITTKYQEYISIVCIVAIENNILKSLLVVIKIQLRTKCRPHIAINLLSEKLQVRPLYFDLPAYLFNIGQYEFTLNRTVIKILIQAIVTADYKYYII